MQFLRRSWRWTSVYVACMLLAASASWVVTGNLRQWVGIVAYVVLVVGVVVFLVHMLVSIKQDQARQPEIYVRVNCPLKVTPKLDWHDWLLLACNVVLSAGAGLVVGFWVNWSEAFASNAPQDVRLTWKLALVMAVLVGVAAGVVTKIYIDTRQWQQAVAAEYDRQVAEAEAWEWRLLGYRFKNGRHYLDIIRDRELRQRIVVDEKSLRMHPQKPGKVHSTVTFNNVSWDGERVFMKGHVFVHLLDALPPLKDEYCITLKV